MDRRQQTAAAAKRYREMARDRKELKRRQKAEGSRVVDTPERVGDRGDLLVQPTYCSISLSFYQRRLSLTQRLTALLAKA